MKKALLAFVAVAAIGGGTYAYYRLRPTPATFTVTSSVVARGDIVETVGATGTQRAVTTVQGGTQVSGTLQSLSADYNSLVKKGQALARLAPPLFQTEIEQARANLVRSQADLDTAEVNVRAAEAQIRSAEAQVVQAQASVADHAVARRRFAEDELPALPQEETVA